MAILRNREVIYLGPANAGDSTPTVAVMDENGNREYCKLTELRFTEDEKKELLKSEENRIDGYNTISDQDLRQLRDSKDPRRVHVAAEQQKKDKEQVEEAKVKSKQVTSVSKPNTVPARDIRANQAKRAM